MKESLRLAQARLDRGSPSINWVRPEAMHLTLKFLGEVDERLIDALGNGLENAASGTGPFNLTVEGVGAFPNQRRPRVIWAGIGASAELTELKERIEQSINALGFEPEEREFSPHLTLCRIKTPEDSMLMGSVLSEENPPLKTEFTVSSVVLFKSVLRPKGAEYTAMREAFLQARQ
ncbi:MAG: RNA 2',3'-cyclic phosphodiesterase [Deltaproteobacteria bacterium]|nr:RNA 2',3'-cyclic phosphodiesterase [Deltaproteobacteria bacterium]MBZ0218865.1 RNA 2',3'-cyclic phosphodiesterase [Deltaproteobacteria bacterium]